MPHHGQWLLLLLDVLVSQNSTKNVAKFPSRELGQVESKWKANHRDRNGNSQAEFGKINSNDFNLVDPEAQSHTQALTTHCTNRKQKAKA